MPFVLKFSKFQLHVVYKREPKNIMQRKVEDKGQKMYTRQILNQASVVILMTVRQSRI